MKFPTPSKKSAQNTAVLVGTAAGGAMLSNGVATLLPSNKYANAILAGLSGYVSAAVKAPALKGLFAGMAIEQATKVVKDIAQKNVKTASISNAKVKSFVESVFGLNSGLAGVVEFAPFNQLSQGDTIADAWEEPAERQEELTIDLMA